MSGPALAHAAYHSKPCPGKDDVVAIRFRCPASFKSTDYLVTIIMQVDLESTFAVKPVKKILRVDCTPGKGGEPCKASGFGHKHTYDKCTHCSAALQVRWRRPRDRAFCSAIALFTARAHAPLLL